MRIASVFGIACLVSACVSSTVEQAAVPTCEGPAPDNRTPTEPALHRESPQYPEYARRMGIEGWICADLLVAPDGTVTGIQTVKSEPEGVFEEDVEYALLRWAFPSTGKLRYHRVAFGFGLTAPRLSVRPLTPLDPTP